MENLKHLQTGAQKGDECVKVFNDSSSGSTRILRPWHQGEGVDVVVNQIDILTSLLRQHPPGSDGWKIISRDMLKLRDKLSQFRRENKGNSRRNKNLARDSYCSGVSESGTPPLTPENSPKKKGVPKQIRGDDESRRNLTESFVAQSGMFSSMVGMDRLVDELQEIKVPFIRAANTFSSQTNEMVETLNQATTKISLSSDKFDDFLDRTSGDITRMMGDMSKLMTESARHAEKTMDGVEDTVSSYNFSNVLKELCPLLVLAITGYKVFTEPTKFNIGVFCAVAGFCALSKQSVRDAIKRALAKLIDVKDSDCAEAQSDFEDIKENALFVLLTILSMIGVRRQPSRTSVSEFFKLAGGFSRAKDGLSDWFDSALQFVQNCFNFVREKVFGMEKVDFALNHNAAFLGWYKRVDVLLAQSSKGQLVINRTNADRVESLRAQGRALLLEFGKELRPNLRIAYEATMRAIKELQAKFNQTMCSSRGPRQEPVVVLFKGECGVGKSKILYPLSMDVLSLVLPQYEADLLKDHMNDFVYSRQIEHQYWDGYYGQPVVLYDDFGQIRDTCGATTLSEYMEVIRTGNLFPNVCHMAALENKGNTIFNSKFMWLSSNLKDVETKIQSLNCPKAVMRRIDFDIEVTIKDEYAKVVNGIKMLDVDKVPNAWSYQVYKFIVKRGNKPPVEMDYRELVNNIVGLYHMRTADHMEYVDLIYQRRFSSEEKKNMARDAGVREEEIEKLFFEYFPTDESKWYFSERMNDSPSFEAQTQGADYTREERENARRVKEELDELLQARRDAVANAANHRQYRDAKVGLNMDDVVEDYRASFDDLQRTHIRNKELEPDMDYDIDNVYEECEKKTILSKFILKNYAAIIHGTKIRPEVLQVISVWLSEKVGAPWGLPLHYKLAILHWLYPKVFFNLAFNIPSNYVPGNLAYIEQILDRLYQDKADQLRTAYQTTKIWTDSTVLDDLKTFWDAVKGEDEGLASWAKDVWEHTSLGKVWRIIMGIGAFIYIKRLLSKWFFPKQEEPEEMFPGVAQDDSGEKLRQRKPLHKKDKKTYKLPHTDKVVTTYGFSAQSGDQNSHDLVVKLINKCMYEVVARYDEIDDLEPDFSQKDEIVNDGPHPKLRRLGQCLAIKQQFIAMPLHFKTCFERLWKRKPDRKIRIRNGLANYNFDFTKEDFERDLRLLPDKDLLICNLGKRLRCHEDITKYFFPEAELSKLQRSQVKMVAFEDYVVSIQAAAGYMDGATLVTHRIGNEIGMIESDSFVDSWTIPRTFKYYIPTVAGDCGAPILIINPTISPYKIIGMHVAGDERRAIGICNTISREDIENVISDAVAQSGGMHELAGFKIIEEGVPTVYQPSVSKIVKSPLYERWGKAKKAPALLRVRQYDDVVINPFMNAIQGYRGASRQIDGRLVRLARDSVISKLQRMPREVWGVQLDRLFTFREAVAGIPGIAFCDGIPRDTSPGYPYVLHTQGKRGKTRWFGSEGDYKFESAAKEVELDVNDHLKRMRDGEVVHHVCMDILKDELRPIEKVQTGKTRLISGTPMCCVIEGRMLCLGFTCSYMHNRIENGSAVGMNPYSYEWHEMSRRLKSKGDKVLAGDISGLDKNEQHCIMLAICDIINWWYDDDDTDTRLRKFHDLMNSYHIFQGTIYQWEKNLPSGDFLTIVLNTLYIHIAVRICWLLLAEPEGYTIEDFDHHVELQVVGDDNIMNVSDEAIEFFNQQTLASAMSRIYLTYTDENKTEGEVPKYRTLEECTFLKRTFRYDHDVNRYVGALSLETILEMPYWTQRHDSNWTILKDKVEIALQELSLHDQRTFEIWAPKILSACSKMLCWRPKVVDYHELKWRTLNIQAIV